MDAGPGLNFLSINKERLLFSVLGPLSVPQIAEEEILRKSQQDRRFATAQTVWKKLPSKLMEVISDDATDELVVAVQRITGTPFGERIRTGADLGETMVIAHAVVAAEAGTDVLILIDEHRGTQIAAGEARRLDDGLPPVEETELLSPVLWARL